MFTGLLLADNAFSIVAVIAAAVLLYFERKGWGWFLIVAALSGFRERRSVQSPTLTGYRSLPLDLCSAGRCPTECTGRSKDHSRHGSTLMLGRRVIRIVMLVFLFALIGGSIHSWLSSGPHVWATWGGRTIEVRGEGITLLATVRIRRK